MKVLLERLTANLNDQRLGRVLCVVGSASASSGQSDEERICEFLLSCGLSLAPDMLKPLARSDAMFVATELFLGPVWGPRPDDRADAENAASCFMTQFEEISKAYSTYKFKIDWDELTCSASGIALFDNSFDMGFFVVDSEHVGVLWLGDED